MERKIIRMNIPINIETILSVSVVETDETLRRHFICEIPIHSDFIEEGGLIDLTPRQKEILTMISENNKISKKGIAQHLEINSSAVDKHIDALKAKG